MSQMNLPDIIGIMGISLILGMYFLLQIGKLQPRDIAYSVGNMMGSTFLLISLFFNWNLSAVILQCTWIAVSVYGILKAMRLKHNHA